MPITQSNRLPENDSLGDGDRVVLENCADPGFFQRRAGGAVSIYALIISRSYTLVSTSLMIRAVHVVKYRKIPKISPRACIFQRPLLRGLFLEGLIFGGAYLRRGICVSKSIGVAL